MDFRRIYCFGDIHGEYDEFLSTLAWIEEDGLDLRFDLLVSVGDIIDGGKESSRVVSHWRGLQEEHPENVVVLLGNHEDLLINADGRVHYHPDFLLWWQQGGQATYKSYAENSEEEIIKRPVPLGKALSYFVPGPDMRSDIEWFKTLPLHYETEEYIFVHAGLRPPLGPKATSRHDKLWIRDDFLNSTYDWGKIVVHGHTANRRPELFKNRINVDTRARVGSISAVRLGEGQPLFFNKYGSFRLETF